MFFCDKLDLSLAIMTWEGSQHPAVSDIILQGSVETVGHLNVSFSFFFSRILTKNVCILRDECSSLNIRENVYVISVECLCT